MDSRLNKYGSVDGVLIGLTTFRSSPALVLRDRLSGARVTCVLKPDLARRIGSEHRWSEVWEKRRFSVSGKLSHDPNGAIRRIDVHSLEEITWVDVSLADLQKIDILEGRTIREHREKLWGKPLV